MSISIIAAVAENNAIGRNNDLPWHLPADMKYFMKITTGHKIIMGRNTYLSMPDRPLKNRTNIVITNNREASFDGCRVVHSIDEAAAHCDPDEECFVIGGGVVYRQFLPLADKLYLTRIHASFEADTFFPEINYGDWKLVEKKAGPPDEKHDIKYDFLIYTRNTE